jgi:hypothetical protein
VLYLICDGPFHDPWCLIALGLSWAGFACLATFCELKTIELKGRQIAVELSRISQPLEAKEYTLKHGRSSKGGVFLIDGVIGARVSAP